MRARGKGWQLLVKELKSIEKWEKIGLSLAVGSAAVGGTVQLKSERKKGKTFEPTRSPSLGGGVRTANSRVQKRGGWSYENEGKR